MLKHISRIVLVFFAPAVLAVTSGFTALSTVATDNKVYAARFAIGLSVDGGQSWQSAANVNQNVLIKGSIDPAPEHVGGKADIFVVEWVAGQFRMLTASGTWVPWLNLEIGELQPAWEDVTLAQTQDLTIHQGSITTSGQHQLYIGYLPASGSALIYTPTPALFEFSAAVDAQSYFEAEIFDDLVLTKCSLCHVAGGLAGISDLHFIKDANLAQQNFDIFEAFYRQQSDAYDYVLTKVSGGNSHGGGVQLPLGSSDYQTMAAFLGLLDGATTVPTASTITLFDGVKDQSAVDTLRDAALLLAGRLPTSVETAAVAAGGESALRIALPALMQGTHFHHFLKDAANDRLFIRGNEDFNLADDCPICFPGVNAEYWRLTDAAATSTTRGAAATFMSQLNYSLLEAPLELIAYVVEQDKPYSEILTADYDMLTKLFNSVAGGTAVFASDADPLEFQPGRIAGYYLRDSSTVVEQVSGAPLPKITNPGNLKINYPHVGILNSKAFLSRYPSTATNRNRARARWTYYNFLGVDIEALAKRTTDPVALADTNNPTMNNSACIVCHSVLDPVAGTFQDYGDNGTYKTALNGTDSLDRFYKAGALTGTTGYKTGDTWYADMRVPGFEGAAATSTNTTRWLAEKIVNDARFASSAVKFWWPAVMGAELLKAPEVATDLDYAARLAAYEAQQAAIETLTDSFVQSGLSLKALLVEMVLGRWYRADSLDGTAVSAVQSAARALAGATGEKLLTPEQLARKTQVLTGFNWYAQANATTGDPVSGLENDYNTFYGGIDSFALKIRAREITPMMSNVAAAHALESSCPIVLGDFIRPDAQRLLFGSLSPWVTPLTEASTTMSLTSTGSSDFKSTSLTLTLQPGAKKVVMSVLNDACDYAGNATQCKASKNMVIGSISIRNPAGQTTTVNGNTGTFGACAAATSGNSLTLYSACTAEYAFTAATSGSYTVTASLAATQSSSDPVLAGMNVEANVTPSTSTAAGATALKNKLVELHGKLLGQTLTVTSSEVLASYDLLLQTWQERRAGSFVPALLQGSLLCEWSGDIGFIGTLSYPGSPLGANGRYATTAVTNWLAPQAQDPLYMKQSWAVVMAYLLSHYDYLHE
jgi:hypothetical protein